MEKSFGQIKKSPEFPEFIGQDYEQWLEYREENGQEAYKYRRLYEEAARQLANLYKYADEHNLDLPDPGDGFA